MPTDQQPLPITLRSEAWVPPPGSIIRTPRRRSSRPRHSQPTSTVPSLPPTPLLRELEGLGRARIGGHANIGGTRATRLPAAPSPEVVSRATVSSQRMSENVSATAREQDCNSASAADTSGRLAHQGAPLASRSQGGVKHRVLPPLLSDQPIPAFAIAEDSQDITASADLSCSSTPAQLFRKSANAERISENSFANLQTAISNGSRFRMSKAIVRRKTKRQKESRGNEARSVALSSSPEWIDPAAMMKRVAQFTAESSFSGPSVSVRSAIGASDVHGRGPAGLAMPLPGSRGECPKHTSPTQTFSVLTPLTHAQMPQGHSTTSLEASPSAGSSFRRRSLALFNAAIPNANPSRETVHTSQPGTVPGSSRSSLANPSRENLLGAELAESRLMAAPHVRESETSSRGSSSASPSVRTGARASSSEFARPSLSSSSGDNLSRAMPDVLTANQTSISAVWHSSSREDQEMELPSKSKLDFSPRNSVFQAWRPAENTLVSPRTMVPAGSYVGLPRASAKVSLLHDDRRPSVQLRAAPRSQSSNNLQGSYKSSAYAAASLSGHRQSQAHPARPGTAQAWIDDTKSSERKRAATRLMRSISNRRPTTSVGEGSRGSSPEPVRTGFLRRSESTSRPADRPSTALAGFVTPAKETLSGSRLEATGGAAALFGGGALGPLRPRASSLLPNLSIFSNGSSRARTITTSTGKESSVHQQRPSSRGVSTHLSPHSSLDPTISMRSSSAEALPAAMATPPRGHVPTPAARTPTLEPEVGEEVARPHKTAHKYPPLAGETPAAYAARIENTVERSEVSSVLASSSDDFFAEALRFHMQKFLFTDNPLDIALRKLLMELRLPKETQQIDRVMEAFAKRYNECNEGLFVTEDQPYILAFSLMMLHTDAFNRNAKNKMSKADYVKNTAASGVPQDVLEYLYDNLTFTQIVYSDESQSTAFHSERSGTSGGNFGSSSFFASMTSGANGSRDKNSKIDAYLIIRQGQLNQLRPNIERIIPEDDPFSYTGSDARFDVAGLARAYTSAPSIEVGVIKHLSVSGPAPADGPSTSTTSSQGLLGPELVGGELGSGQSEVDSSVTLRVFKVGIVNRKDEVTEKGKKSSRKWKPNGMILTSSQLLFFRDLVWIDALQAQIGEQLAAATPEERKRGILVSPRISNLRPDGLLSLGDAIALKDYSYKRHESVLRLVETHGNVQHEYLFQARDETDMNEWIAGINFCACFRWAGVRITNLDALALTNVFKVALPVGRSGSAASNVPVALSCSGSCSGLESPSAWSPLDSLQQGSPKGPNNGSSALASSPSATLQLLREKVAARRRELTPKVEEVARTLDESATELQELLRLARQFALMTPFQRATRERIEAAAAPLATRIRQLRIMVAKYECRYRILLAEVQVGDCAIDPGLSAAQVGQDDSRSLLMLAQQECKGLFCLPEIPGCEDLTSELGSLTLSSSRQDTSAGSLRPVSEASEGDGSGPVTPATPSIDSAGIFGLSIGSFAGPYQEKSSGKVTAGGVFMDHDGSGDGGASSVVSHAATSPRSLLIGVQTKSGKGTLDGSGPRDEVAESWNATRAFRDPDRISLAQLPSIETIEAAPREKARRRTNNSNFAGKRSLLMHGLTSSGPGVGNGSSCGGKGSSARATSVSSGSRRGGLSSSLGGGYSGLSSSGSGSGRDEIPIQERTAEPPVFMSTWGV